MEKIYIVYMCIVEIHEMKQGQIQSKRRPTTSDKTCWDTLQSYLFFALTLTKMLTVANTISPFPIAMLFTVTEEIKCTLEPFSQNNIAPGVDSGEGGGGRICSLWTRWLYGAKLKTALKCLNTLSEVVDFFVVVLTGAVFNRSTKSSVKRFLNFTYEE